MTRTTEILIFVAICFIAVTSAKDPFELVEGNCSHAQAGDMVLLKHVHKYALPLTTREETGNGRIYCITVLSESKDTKSGVRVSNGGVWYSFADVYVHSERVCCIKFYSA
ncbi:unnamed protein product [Acanthoscelides obtectus]|uniref:Uncharacterized protein n=1 Tax=Acanthoscelides obtectus TaxID=200917 RepID=A0A9P0LDJ6_ACAOB|nr:unnamed protein product [Acanthoscelides obtectus]CAK1655196.1 hypothetical protein AOBTE_LOCUS19075 [Acanthoscelides obtectus]